MPDAEFRNDPNAQGLVEPTTYVATDTNRFNPNLSEPQHLARLDRQVRRLSTWLGALTGVTILSIGLLSGVAYWLKRENDRMVQQLSALDSYKAEVVRIQNLESSINGLENQVKTLNQNQNLLNQQIPKGLATQLKGIQNSVSTLQVGQANLQKGEARAVTREQVEQSIQRAVRQQRATVVTPSPSSPFLNPPNQ